MPILAGAGQASTRETIKLAKEAASAGADHVIIVPGGYYAGALKSDPSTLKQFFVDVAAESPLPVCVLRVPCEICKADERVVCCTTSLLLRVVSIWIAISSKRLPSLRRTLVA